MRRIQSLAAIFLCVTAGMVGPRIASADEIVPEVTAQRHGLTRAWFVQVDIDRSRSRIAHITQHKGMLLLQTDRGMVHALDAETGRTFWAQQIGHANHPSMAPAANDKFVAVVNGSYLYLANRATGLVLWQRRLGGSPGAGAAMSAQHVFVPMVNGTVEGYDIEYLDKQPEKIPPPWIYKSDGRALIQPMVTPQTVSWTTDKGYLYVGGADKLGIKFRLKTHEAIESRPAYWTPYLYACSLDGYVYAVEEATGRTEWKFSTGDPLNEPPVAINQSVYVISNAGGMFCLDGKTGRQVWFAPRLKQFIAASPERVYASDKLGGLVMLNAKTGARQDVIPVSSSIKLINTQTDRIVLASSTGVVQCLHETQLVEPVVYEPPKAATEIKAGKTKKKVGEPADEETPEEPTDEGSMEAPSSDSGESMEAGEESPDAANPDDPFSG